VPISSPSSAGLDERLMAARRLLIVMLVLLGLSTLAAALLPPQALEEDTTGSTTTTTEATETTPTETVPRGKELAQQRIKVGGKRIPVVSCPARLRRVKGCKPIEAGDQLSLVVSSTKADELEMPAFGLVDSVGPNKPARFEILVTSPGSYKLRFVSTGRIAARIVVERSGARSRARGEPDRA
jgi:hypothetical protein